MHRNLQEKSTNIAFQILKIYKAFSNFDYNSTIRKKIHWILHLFENMASLSDKNCDNPTRFHKILHCVE